MVKRYTEDQRGRIGEKLLDLGNIAAGALLFGQFISDRPFHLLIAVLGILAVIVLYLVGLWVMRGGE
ncbi:MAG: hypothetical protein K8L97_20460 [Anaerolineae bacterium]|nr:hypothetical protein [Anaerolineae bacterium]